MWPCICFKPTKTDREAWVQNRSTRNPTQPSPTQPNPTFHNPTQPNHPTIQPRNRIASAPPRPLTYSAHLRCPAAQYFHLARMPALRPPLSLFTMSIERASRPLASRAEMTPATVFWGPKPGSSNGARFKVSPLREDASGFARSEGNRPPMIYTRSF